MKLVHTKKRKANPRYFKRTRTSEKQKFDAEQFCTKHSKEKGWYK